MFKGSVELIRKCAYYMQQQANTVKWLEYDDILLKKTQNTGNCFLILEYNPLKLNS